MSTPETNKGVAVTISSTALIRVLTEWALDRYVSSVLKYTNEIRIYEGREKQYSA